MRRAPLQSGRKKKTLMKVKKKKHKNFTVTEILIIMNEVEATKSTLSYNMSPGVTMMY